MSPAFFLGGHVRVGMEDNLHISKCVLCKSNAELGEKMARIMEEFGYDPATPAKARDILKLRVK